MINMGWENILKKVDMSPNRKARSMRDKQLNMNKLFEEAKPYIREEFVGKDGHGLFAEMMVIHVYEMEEPAHFKQLLDEAIKYTIDNNTKEEIIDWYYEEYKYADPEGEEYWLQEEEETDIFGNLRSNSPFQTEEDKKRRDRRRLAFKNRDKVVKTMRDITAKLRKEHFDTHGGMHQYEHR